MLTLTVLGCDGSHPGPDGAGSGYLVRSSDSGTTVWVDAGPGTFANLQRYCDPTTVDAVVLSHEHPDHWTDIQSYLVAARHTWHLERSVPVIAPRGLRSWVYGADNEAASWVEAQGGDRLEIGGLVLSFSETDHGPVTLAVRVDGDGTSLGYSADAGPGWSLKALGPGLDLALCEATYTREHEGTLAHMSGRQAGETARDAKVGRLVITHRWPTISAAELSTEAAAAFGRPVEQAAIGREYSL